MKKRWWWFAPLVIPAGFIAGWAMPPPPLPKAKAETDAWSLVAVVPPVADAQAIITGSGWEGEGGGDPSAEWKLMGTILPRHALVQVAGAETRRVAVGESMPDESLLLSVSRARITIERSGCRLVYSVYTLSPVSSSGAGCPPPASAPTSDAVAPAAGQTQEPNKK